MIEVIHYKRRDGKPWVAVIGSQYDLFFDCPDGKIYAERYAAGLEPAFYKLPVPLSFTPTVVFAAFYAVKLLMEMFDERDYTTGA